MDDKKFNVDIVTPRKVVFSGQVQSISAPGECGGFQVLVGHAPLLSSLTVGEIKIVDASGATIRYATSGGFLEVKNNKVIVLAETAEQSSEIDVKRAESARERAKNRLHVREKNLDTARAESALARALNRLRIVVKGV
jgi:F-type H+-transporting ATPase subunit epsilon